MKQPREGGVRGEREEERQGRGGIKGMSGGVLELAGWPLRSMAWRPFPDSPPGGWPLKRGKRKRLVTA